MKTRLCFLHRLTLAGAAILAGCLALPGHARAQVLVYTTQASYNAASSGNTIYTFPTPAQSTDVAPSYTDGPLTFAVTSGSQLVLNDNVDYGSGVACLSARDSTETVTLSGATALSFNLGARTADTIAISVNGAAATSVTEAGGDTNAHFVGFTDTVPITSLTFTDTTYPPGGPQIDTVTFQMGSNPNAVPEPSSWALLCLGVAGLGLTPRRRAARVLTVTEPIVSPDRLSGTTPSRQSLFVHGSPRR